MRERGVDGVKDVWREAIKEVKEAVTGAEREREGEGERERWTDSD